MSRGGYVNTFLCPEHVAVKAPRPRFWSWLLILAVLVAGTYAAGLGGFFFADDFQFYLPFGPSRVLQGFVDKVPDNSFYRPLEIALLTTLQTLFPLDPLPIHLVIMVLHLLLAWLVYVAMIHLGFARTSARIASVFMAVAQANVHAVLSLDTLSQVGSTLLGCCTLWRLHTRETTKVAGNGRLPGGGALDLPGLVLFAMSLFAKETGVSWFLPSVLILVMKRWWCRPRRHAAICVVLDLLSLVVVLCLYLGIRGSVVGSGPSLGSGRYDFRFGVNVVQNVGMLLFAALMPFSSVSYVVALKNGHRVVLAGVALVTAAVAAGALRGCARSGRRAILAVLAVLSVLALFPMAALNHVSELYAYNSLPLIAMLIGAGWGEIVRSAGSRLWMNLVRVFLAILFVSHVAANQHKATLVRRNGDRSRELMNQVRPWLSQVPPGGVLRLVHPLESQGTEYSIFLVRGFNLLGEGEHGLARALGRPDVHIQVVGAGTREPLPSGQGVSLTLAGDRVVPVEPERVP